MRIYLFILFSLVSYAFSFGQQKGNFNTNRNWALNKKEYMYGIGVTNFLGDLGGKNQVGTDFSLIDVDFKATSINLQGGYRYRWRPKWATVTTLNLGLVRGSDKFTEDHIRESRNLSFRSPIVSVNQRFDFIISAKETVGGRYKIPGLNRFDDINYQFYLFAGFGLAYYNPQAQYNGTWYNLRELRTEGQGLEGGPKMYRRCTFILPSGVGIRTGINKVWRVGLEATLIKTFSDYIDDVSGVYYNQEKLRDLYGDASAYFSNPAGKNHSYFVQGEQRGDKQKDSYVTLNLVFYKNITYKPANIRYGRVSRYNTVGRYRF